MASNRLRSMIVGLLVLSLSACVTPVKYEATKNTSVKSITIIGPANPDAYGFFTEGMAWGQAIGSGIGGAIGGVIYGAATTDVANERITRIATDAGLKLGDLTADLIEKGLTADGYQISRAQVVRPKPRAFLPEKYVAPGESDAVLDIYFEKVEIQDNPFYPAVPFVLMNAQLRERATNRVLFRQAYACQHIESIGANKAFVAPDQFTFSNEAEIFGNPERVVGGFKFCVTKMAEHIVTALHRPATTQ